MSVSSQFQGLEGSKQKTATQASLDQQQNLMKIGLAVLGVVEFEKNLVNRRIVNILRTWTAAIDKKMDDTKKRFTDVYRTISIEDEFDGQTGVKMIKFTEENYMNSDEIMREEDELEEIAGKPVRITYIRPSFLRNIKNNWYVEITPTEKQTSELKKATFKQDIADTVTLFGIESTNLEGLKPRWAQMIKEDKDVLFNEGGQAMPMQPGTSPEVNGSIQPQRQAPKVQQPTVNSLQGNIQ
jgi:hypothetical protein